MLNKNDEFQVELKFKVKNAINKLQWNCQSNKALNIKCKYRIFDWSHKWKYNSRLKWLIAYQIKISIKKSINKRINNSGLNQRTKCQILFLRCIIYLQVKIKFRIKITNWLSIWNFNLEIKVRNKKNTIWNPQIALQRKIKS